MNTKTRHEWFCLPVVTVDRLLDAEASPLLAPRIHAEAADYLMQKAKAAKCDQISIDVQVPEEDLSRSHDVEEAIRSHFVAQVNESDRELSETLKHGRLIFLIALLVVAMVVVVSEWLQTLGSGRVFNLLGESLIIIGWVTLWTPAEMLLFDQLPIRRKRKLARVIAEAKIRLVPRPPNS